jgi:hypothetical protein
MLVQSHVREVSSRHPSLSSRAKAPGSFTGAVPRSSPRPRRKAALTRKVSESIASPHPAPMATTTSPPSAGPTRLPTLSARATSPLARWNFERGTSCGTSPSAAGRNRAVAAPLSADSVITCHNSAAPVMNSAASAAWVAARARSETIIRAWRGTRSAHTPPASRNTTIVTVRRQERNPGRPRTRLGPTPRRRARR